MNTQAQLDAMAFSARRAEMESRRIVEAKKSADAAYKAGLDDPLMAHFINRLLPPEQPEITGGNQV